MDYVELEKIITQIESKKRSADKHKALLLYVQKYIEEQNASMVADLALYFLESNLLTKDELMLVEEAIIRLRDPYASWRFARFAPTNRLSEHEEIVLEANNPVYSITFADIKGADVSKHSKVILAANSGKYSFDFLMKHKNVDKSNHIANIINEGDGYRMYEIANKLRGVGCKKLEDALFKLRSPFYSYLYAKNVPGADILGHQGVVLFHGTCEQTCQFARDIDKADMKYYFYVLPDIIRKNPTPEIGAMCREIIRVYEEREQNKNKNNNQKTNEDENT